MIQAMVLHEVISKYTSEDREYLTDYDRILKDIINVNVMRVDGFGDDFTRNMNITSDKEHMENFKNKVKNMTVGEFTGVTFGVADSSAVENFNSVLNLPKNIPIDFLKGMIPIPFVDGKIESPYEFSKSESSIPITK